VLGKKSCLKSEKLRKKSGLDGASQEKNRENHTKSQRTSYGKVGASPKKLL
jgi:hypothetical protein